MLYSIFLKTTYFIPSTVTYS